MPLLAACGIHSTLNGTQCTAPPNISSAFGGIPVPLTTTTATTASPISLSASLDPSPTSLTPSTIDVVTTTFITAAISSSPSISADSITRSPSTSPPSHSASASGFVSDSSVTLIRQPTSILSSLSTSPSSGPNGFEPSSFTGGAAASVSAPASLSTSSAVNTLATPTSTDVGDPLSSSTALPATKSFDSVVTPAASSAITGSSSQVVAQSETIATSAAAFTAGGGAVGTHSPTQTAGTTQVSPSSNTSSQPGSVSTGAVVGGVIGGLAFVAIIGTLAWFCYKRRRSRDPLLAPLGTLPSTSSYQSYEIDRDSLGPTPKSERFKAILSTKLRRFQGGIERATSGFTSTLSRDRTVPRVNLNRGNSQFMEIAQHSRNNSLVHSQPESDVPFTEKMSHWVESIIQKMPWSRDRDDQRFRSPSPTDELREKPSAVHNRFSRLSLSSQPVQQRRHRQSSSDPQFHLGTGNLGLSFTSSDPFADPPTREDVNRQGPANAAIARPPPAAASDAPLGANYVADVRRSRGASISSRPNTLVSNDGSYRDTTYSLTTRGEKGRSDPFDLEAAASWTSSSGMEPVPPMPANYPASGAGTTAKGAARQDGSAYSDAITRRSSYISKVSGFTLGTLGDWGDPGPDVRSSAGFGPALNIRESETLPQGSRTAQRSIPNRFNIRSSRQSDSGSEYSDYMGVAL